VADRQKGLQNNQSLYGDHQAYMKHGEVEPIEFKNCVLGLGLSILAIDQTFIESSRGRRSQTNQIVIYAAESESLRLQMFKLNCDGDGFEGDEDTNTAK